METESDIGRFEVEAALLSPPFYQMEVRPKVSSYKSLRLKAKAVSFLVTILNPTLPSFLFDTSSNPPTACYSFKFQSYVLTSLFNPTNLIFYPSSFRFLIIGFFGSLNYECFNEALRRKSLLFLSA